jgi:hypothetical protein
MKIAALCDFPYWDGKIGTAVRYESLCQSLAGTCDLTMICTVTLQSKYRDFPGKRRYRLIDRRMLKAIDEECRPPDLPGVRSDRQMELRSIKQFVEREGFDAILTPYFNREWMTRHLAPSILRIVDTHDCQSQRTRSFLRHGLIPTFPMTPQEEGRQLDRYDVALAMSDEDHSEFVAMSSIPVVTAPFRLPRREKLVRVREGHNLLFVAAQSDVNALTLAYLLHQILPLVDRKVTLNVVGNVAVPGRIPANVKLVCHEQVDDIAEAYRRVDLALNPVFAGGGVKTKTLEALSFGVPILTSDEGARGLRHLIPDALIVNDKETCAWKIGALLADTEACDALSNEIFSRVEAEDTVSWVGTLTRILAALKARRAEVAA